MKFMLNCVTGEKQNGTTLLNMLAYNNINFVDMIYIILAGLMTVQIRMLTRH